MYYLNVHMLCFILILISHISSRSKDLKYYYYPKLAKEEQPNKEYAFIFIIISALTRALFPLSNSFASSFFIASNASSFKYLCGVTEEIRIDSESSSAPARAELSLDIFAKSHVFLKKLQSFTHPPFWISNVAMETSCVVMETCVTL